MGIETATLLAYAAAASAAVGTYSAIQQGEQADAMGEYQQRQAEADAAIRESEAMVQARQIRKAADQQRAAARAALASSGVTVGAGTAELIDKDINANAQQDALTAIYNGNTAALQTRQEGAISKIAGSNARSAGYMNAASTALSGIGTAYRAWGGGTVKDSGWGDTYKWGRG